jgi:predicted MPP superfamily phosphohydrolase
MTISILHISDLHRERTKRVSTDGLIESLRNDLNRYTQDEELLPPDIAVVSGDIVQGVKADEPDALVQLSQQYDESYNSLVKLGEMLFEGDRSRIVIVPGNHDVSLPHFAKATRPVDIPVSIEQRALLLQRFKEEGSPLRWSWNDFSMIEIIDMETYNKRLEPFSDFYSKFYEGKRSYSLDPNEQFSIHDFSRYGVVIVGFSSCHENDILNKCGALHPDSIAKANREVSNFIKKGRLPIAAWHHSLRGGPKDNDYVDDGFLQSLIDSGFVLGLHGHQHSPQVVEHRFTADRKRGMTVISSGTLCGGPHSLPSGRMRSYNLLYLSIDSGEGKVHVREMKNSDFRLPVWGKAYIIDFSGDSLEFNYEPPKCKQSESEAIEEAAVLLRKGHFNEAYTVARPFMDNPWARRLVGEALGKMKDWAKIVDDLASPRSPSEFMLLGDALLELGRNSDLASLLSSSFAAQSDDLGVKQYIGMMSRHTGEM